MRHNPTNYDEWNAREAAADKARADRLAEIRAVPPVPPAPKSAGLVVMESFVERTTVDKAKRLVAGIEAGNQRVEWERAILASPEAQARPRAAARLVELSTPASMSLPRAKSTLRGLRVETAPDDDRPPPTPAAARPAAALAESEDEHRERRRREIRTAALSYRADRGDYAARRELNAIRTGRAA